MKGEPGTFGPYRLLAGAVVPRPIAWVSSRSAAGVDNLAPYSFFNVVAVDPPVLMFAPVGTGGDLKDTPRNVLDTGEFVVNVVTADLAERMNETSASLPSGESEFDRADLAKAEAEWVNAARVADAKISFECRLYDSIEVGGSTMILGEVVYAHVDDEVTTGGKLDVTKLDAVGRLSGSHYATTRDRFAMERPP
ncbi:flavin reductase family protein [Halegenticoccus tardaugens]|uniref:flavin reductase family protein n=1 Tax=Halegenticoccus tardaugens TaxID=2071624 RepID=UPI00100A9FD1|nr:flavin reductase family protein [Halegenticoccus tardaugens]